jgi:hypothetical protein
MKRIILALTKEPMTLMGLLDNRPLAKVGLGEDVTR